jgi:hypothetical protein
MCSTGSLNIHPRFTLILADFYDPMRPFHHCFWLALKVFVKKLSQLIQGQDLHLVWIVFGQ